MNNLSNSHLPMMGMRLILSDFDWWAFIFQNPLWYHFKRISGKGRFVEQQMNLSSGSTSPNLFSCYDLSAIRKVHDQLDSQPLCTPDVAKSKGRRAGTPQPLWAEWWKQLLCLCCLLGPSCPITVKIICSAVHACTLLLFFGSARLARSFEICWTFEA